MRSSFRFSVVVTVVVTALLCVVPDAQAQYFGRNKVQWENFHFKVLKTEHFDIYYYDEEADVVPDMARMAERWYTRLSHVFQHTFNRKPIVLYANAADFQQTTTTQELIGEGTGGFTDEYQNRVVLPLTGDYAENDHVLGHELVHVFQYDIAASLTNGRRRFNIEAMPLWLIEGMAEYFSKGRVDSLTAMWMRDAAIHDRLPDLKKLTRDPRYFPYRYGEALMAYIGGRYGDDAVVRYFLAAGQTGIEAGFERVLGISPDELFRDWHASAHELYDPIVKDRPVTLTAPILSKKTTRGELNVGPAVSPDGEYIAFLSSRELFSIDLYIASTHTGQIIRHLVSSEGDAHFDALRFIDSAGGWSPDSSKLAFVVFEHGDNYLGVVDVKTRKVDRIRIPGVDSLTNPVFSPNGTTVAFSGQTTGVTDLFTYDLQTKEVHRLTDDKFADLQPAYSADGRRIAFVTDRGADASLDQLRFNGLSIAVMDLGTKAVTLLPLFPNAKNINPQFAPDGRSIYFVSNPDGIPDVFRINLADNAISRITKMQTGVSGITELSPALSVASRSGDVAVSVYENDAYSIYTLPPSPVGTAIATNTVAADPRGAQLPPLRGTGSLITKYMDAPQEGLPPAQAGFRVTNPSSALHVAYVGPPTIGVAGGRFGYGVGGSVAAYFTDVLGRQNLGVSFEGTSSGVGTFADQIGGEVLYLNQANRFNWGADFSHIPYASAFTGYSQQPVTVNGQDYLADVYTQETVITRVDDMSLLAQYPFSTTQRFETSGGFQRFSQKAQIEQLVYVGSDLIDDTKQGIPGANYAINMFRASAAYVGDNSTFGFISPVRGSRYRFEFGANTGDLKFQTALADWRKYIYVRPVSVGLRAIHYGRYGSGAEDPRLTPLYLSDGDLVRGYDVNSISANECVAPPGSNSCPVFDRLVGSRLLAGSIEARMQLFGTKEFGLVNAPWLPTELIAFFDGGTAWSSGQHPKWAFDTNNSTDLIPVFSAGVGARILLGYIPFEVYWAKPFQRPEKNWVFGFNIISGW